MKCEFLDAPAQFLNLRDERWLTAKGLSSFPAKSVLALSAVLYLLGDPPRWWHALSPGDPCRGR